MCEPRAYELDLTLYYPVSLDQVMACRMPVADALETLGVEHTDENAKKLLVSLFTIDRTMNREWWTLL